MHVQSLLIPNPVEGYSKEMWPHGIRASRQLKVLSKASPIDLPKFDTSFEDLCAHLRVGVDLPIRSC